MKKHLTVLASLVTFFTACNLVAASEPNTTPAEPNRLPKAAADSIAVTVNGVDIMESQIEAQVKAQVKSQLQRMRARLPSQVVEQYKKNQLRRELLEKMIVELLLDEKVKANNVVVTEQKVIAYLEKTASQQRPPLSVEQLKARIEARGQSFDQVKQQIQKGLAYQKLIEAEFIDKISITVEDANQYYKKNRKQYETPEQVRASHILIKPDTSDPNADPNEAKAKARAKAQDLLKQIKAGANFAELAKLNSSCPSAARGGDLSFFSRGRMVPAFEKAAFELEVGQVSDIVETQFGYHIIKVADRKDAGITTFEQVKDDILNMLKQKKHAELAVEYIESLKAQADIVYPAGKEPDSSSIIIPTTKQAPSETEEPNKPKDKTAVK